MALAPAARAPAQRFPPRYRRKTRTGWRKRRRRWGACARSRAAR